MTIEGERREALVATGNKGDLKWLAWISGAVILYFASWHAAILIWNANVSWGHNWWVHQVFIPWGLVGAFCFFGFCVWERIALKVQPPLQFFGWGEDYDWDPNRLWRRKLDSIAYWGAYFFKKAFISGAATSVYLVAFFVLQAYIYANKVTEAAPPLAFLNGHPTLKVWSPWIAGVGFGLLLVIPLVSSKIKATADRNYHHDLVEEHLIPFLDTQMAELVSELMAPADPDDPEVTIELCVGNVRANITVVRRQWFNRYLTHLASSEMVQRTDREVCFLLDEGVAGWAYSRPGDLRIETREESASKCRPSTLDKLSTTSKVIACRAIGLDLRKVQRPWFNRVVGVIIITSDNASDRERFADPLFGHIVHASADSLGRLLADIRRAYDA